MPPWRRSDVNALYYSTQYVQTSSIAKQPPEEEPRPPQTFAQHLPQTLIGSGASRTLGRTLPPPLERQRGFNSIELSLTIDLNLDSPDNSKHQPTTPQSQRLPQLPYTKHSNRRAHHLHNGTHLQFTHELHTPMQPYPFSNPRK